MFVVHADEDTPFVKGELLPMLGLPEDRVILSSELPFPAFTEQAIEQSVQRSRLTLAVLSPAYLRDRWASFAELLSRNVTDDGRDGGSLVPILIADCEIPPVLAQHMTLDGRTPQRWEASAARLRARLDRPDPWIEPIACPYPGMRPFSAETALQFHGRKSEIDELLGWLRAGEQEIYVIGPSGSGKSSLVAAGVVPCLSGSDRKLDGVRFEVRTLRPGEHPAQRLTEALACDTTGQADSQASQAGLAGAAGWLLDRAGSDRLLIFVDQLEELFTLAGTQERDRFVDALRVLRADRRCQLIVALRADFYGSLMSSELWPDIAGRFARLEVAPLRGDALREAIEAPAREAGVYFERALVERLVSDAATEPGALPLLQEALVLLWERRTQRLLSVASYEELGSAGRSGLAAALAKRADAIFHAFSPAQQVLVRRILLRLVSFGEGRPDTRRQQPRAALSTAGADAADFDEVMHRLIDGRLLTSDATAQGEPLVDLSHEALIAGWPVLQGWLLSRREDEQRRRLLELHVAAWIQRNRGSVGLFDAVELAEAERWIAGEGAQELGYSGDLPRFLAASREAIEEAERQQQLARAQQERARRAAQEERARQRRRLVRFTVVGLAVFSVVVSVLGLAAWQARRATRLQLGLNELEQARVLASERHDPASAIPHLVQAMNLGVDNAVLRTLLADARKGLWRVAVRHGAAVRTAAFSPDGTRIATASEDGTARVWDAATGAPIGAPLKHDKLVRDVVFSPDGTRVVTASEDGTARIWDAESGVPVGSLLMHEQAVRSVTFSPDGTRMVTTSNDGTARVWDAATGAPVGSPLKHEQIVMSAVFSPDGTRVMTASLDGTARSWDVVTGRPVGAPLRYGNSVRNAVFSPDGTRLVTTSDNGMFNLDGAMSPSQKAQIWDVATGIPLGGTIKLEETNLSVAFSPDGTRVVTAASDGKAQIRDAASGTPVGSPLKHERAIWHAAFSPDGTRVVTAGLDGTARIWNAATGAPVGGLLKHEQGVGSARFSPDGTRVVTASLDGTARIWDSAIETPLGRALKHEQVFMFSSAALSPDGARLVTMSYGPASEDGTMSKDRTAQIWDVATGIPVGVPIKHEQTIKSTVFSPDGTWVVTASMDGTARIWDAMTGTPVGVPLKHDRPVLSASLSLDGKRVVTVSSDRAVRIWDATTGTLKGDPIKYEEIVTSAAFSPDGTRVVTASMDGTARIWDVARGTPVGSFSGHEQMVKRAAASREGTRVATSSSVRTARGSSMVTGLSEDDLIEQAPVVNLLAAFSPDGTRVVTADVGGTVRIWNAGTGALMGIPFTHEKIVHSVAFSPDGTRVVTAGSDQTARIWDAASGTPVGTPFRHERHLGGAVFSPDGTRVVTVTMDGTTRVWNVTEAGTLSGWSEQARRCVVPGFSAEGSSVVCPLSHREPTSSEMLVRARSLTAAGDAAMRSLVWSASRTHYQQAFALLDGKPGLDLRANEREWNNLRHTVLMRLAVLDAFEGNLQDARVHIGLKASATDALLLDQLGEFAYEQLKIGVVALELLERAHDLDPEHANILLGLAEVYFSVGRYEDFLRISTKLSKADTQTRVAMAALAWATARLTRALDGVQVAQLMHAYGELANHTFVHWSWRGTRHALKYGRIRFEEVKPILEVFALLEAPVTDQTRARLADLLQAK